MPTASSADLPAHLRDTHVWTTALLQSLAREESAGRKPARLTEPGLATWGRFRGRLSTRDLVALLLEDAAVLHPVPFDARLLDAPVYPERLPDAVVSEVIAQAAAEAAGGTGAEHIARHAKAFGIPTRLGRSDLPVMKVHHRVLELPGTGGQLAHHLVSTQQELRLQDNFVVAAGTWQEATLAGMVGLDLGAPRTDFVAQVEVSALREPTHPLRQRSFDFVVGLHPDKGGLFRIDDQLAIWFPAAKIVLV